MTIDYSIMDSAVDKICESLKTEPQKWELGIYCITAPKSFGSIQIEKGFNNEFIKVMLNNSSLRSEIVFSSEQGEKIRKAYFIAKSKAGSQLQKEILTKVSTPKEEPVKVSKPEPIKKLKINKTIIIIPIYFIIIISLLIYILK